jgi:hypothetical protein
MSKGSRALQGRASGDDAGWATRVDAKLSGQDLRRTKGAGSIVSRGCCPVEVERAREDEADAAGLPLVRTDPVVS